MNFTTRLFNDMTAKSNIITCFAAVAAIFCFANSAQAQTNARAQSVAFGKEVPNVITPNGDGVNDEWRLEAGVPDYEVVVYDRWSRKVYAGDQARPFAGKSDAGEKLPEGVYFYRLTARATGLPARGRTGSLTVLR